MINSNFKKKRLFSARTGTANIVMVKSIYCCVFLVSASFLSGCYTQIALYNENLNPTAVADSVSAKVSDTVTVAENNVCFWTEDFFGNPVLRCYKSYYPYNWYAYQNIPWWYGQGHISFGYDRCPRYYYYDASCGNCIRSQGFDYYHDGHHYHDNHYQGSYTGNPPPMKNSGTRQERPRSYGIPAPRDNPSPARISEPKTTQETPTEKSPDNGSGGNTVEPAPLQKEEPKRKPRSYGIPDKE